MKRMAWLVLVGSIAVLALPCSMNAEGEDGSFDVLFYFPTQFHNEELDHMLLQYDDTNAEIYVTSIATKTPSDVALLEARFPERYNVTTNGGPTVTAIDAQTAYGMLFDEFIIAGAGWWDEYFAPRSYEAPEPSIGERLYEALEYALQNHTFIGAIGAGAYPVLFADILPPWFVVPAYPCPDLISVIDEKGYTPAQAPETPRPDGSWPPLLKTQVYVDNVNSAKAAISSIPNSWYPTENGGGEMLIEDYRQDYIDFFVAITQARYEIGTYIPVRLMFVTCGDVGGSIVVQNTGSQPIDLTGWQIRCKNLDGEVTETYTFEACGIPGQNEVSVYYGVQPWSSAENSYYWPDAMPFAPVGGTAELVDPRGIVHSTMGCGD